jgi:hypothetical protein
MQKQYKLYRIDENAIDDVKPLLNDYLYEKINQYIITASIFYRLLLHFVKNGIIMMRE